MKISERTADLCEQCLHVIVFEGQPTTEHNIEDYAAAPYVNFRSSVQTSAYHLRRSIIRAAAAGLEEVTVLDLIRQPKVGDLHVEVCVQ